VGAGQSHAMQPSTCVEGNEEARETHEKPTTHNANKRHTHKPKQADYDPRRPVAGETGICAPMQACAECEHERVKTSTEFTSILGRAQAPPVV